MAVWLLARVALRAGWRSSLALALLFGAAAGLAAASLSTADRIESAYDDLLREVDAPQLLSRCDGCGSYEDFEAVLARLRADPAVADVVPVSLVEPVLRSDSGELLGPSPLECAGEQGLSLVTADWSRSGEPPARIVEGRFASGPRELALPLLTAQRAGVGVGDEVSFEQDCNWSEISEPIPLQVVGLFVGFLDVRPPGQDVSFEFPLVTTEFAQAAGVESGVGGAAIWLRSGRSLADLEPANRESIFLDVGAHANDIRGRLRPDATALRLFTVLITIAAVAVLGQLLARHVRSAASNHTRLRSLGARPINLAVLGIVHGAVVGVATALATVVATLGLAPHVPLGVADYAARGSRMPLPFMPALVAAAVSGFAVTLLSVVPALSSARVRRHTVRSRPSLASRVAGRTHLPVVPALGARIAFEPNSSAQGAPVRSGLGAVVLAMAVVAGVVTFAGSLDHLRATPSLVGWNWDFVVDNDQDSPPPGVDELLATHPDVAGWAWGNSGVGLAVGDSTNEELNYLWFLSFSTGPHAVTPATVAGRAPQGADEILLAADVAELLQADVGDTVDVKVEDWLAQLAQQLEVPTERSPDRTLQFELVGTGILYVSTEPGGAALTVSGVEQIYAPPTREEITAVLVAADFDLLVEALSQEFPSVAEQLGAGGAESLAESLAQWTDEQFLSLVPKPRFNRLYVDLVDGAAPTELLAALNSFGMGVDGFGVEGIVDGRLATTTELVPLDLRDVDWLPTGLGFVMAVTAAAVVALLIASGAKARRRDLATMRALGLKSGQSRRAIYWQAAALVTVAVMVAVPVGVIAGRFAWRRYAEGIGVVPEPVTPWLGLGLLILTLVLVAEMTAIWPAMRAGRDQPLRSLNSE